MSLEGAEREGEVGRRGTVGVVGGEMTGRTGQVDPLSTATWKEFSWNYLGISK
jgi:hypothetical protein